MSVMQGVDYLSDPVEHLFVVSDLAKVETPVLDGLLTDDETLRRILGVRWWWAKGPGSEPNPEWKSGMRRPCWSCGRVTAVRRDGSPVRHKANKVWCPGSLGQGDTTIDPTRR